MNTLMTLAVVDSCCVKVCTHCNHVKSQSVWDKVIEDIPCLVVWLLITLILIFLMKYGVEYCKLFIQNKKNKAETAREKLLDEMRNIVDGIILAIKKEVCVNSKMGENINTQLRRNIELLEQSVNVNNDLIGKIDNKQNIELLEETIKVCKELNEKMSNRQICDQLEKLLRLSEEQKGKIEILLNEKKDIKQE